MGILKLLPARPPVATASTTLTSPLTAEKIAASDPVIAAAFGLVEGLGTVTRAQAMRIPAVRRGRQVIAGTIGALPLIAHRRNADGTVDDVTSERRLLEQPDRNTTRQYVLTWTVDDLLFHGISTWRVTDRDAEGYPRQAEWLHRDRVFYDVPAGRVYVDGQPAKNDDIIRFDGPDEGVLAYGADTLRTTQLLDEAVRRFARLDVPLGSLKLAEGAAELSNEPGSCGIEGDDRSQIDALLDMWEEARRQRTTAYLNRAIDYNVHQFDAGQLQLVEGRQFQLAETARLLNLAPRYVNAPSASSMTYSNVESERRDLVDTSLVGYLAAIEQRLSMGDVTPRGTTVRFDVTGLLRGDTLNALQAAEVAVRLEAMTGAEVRTDVLGRPPLPAGTTPTPTPEA